MTDRPSVIPAPQHLHDGTTADEQESEGTYADGLPGVVLHTEPLVEGTFADGQAGPHPERPPVAGTYAEGLPGVVDGAEPESKGTFASGQSDTAGSGG
jgi:hypothetical protein